MDESRASKSTDATLKPQTRSELESWISEAVAGNREYQKRMYELVASRVYRVIRKVVGASDADDVMQDFILHFFDRLSQFRFESSIETWAHRMAVNQSLQYLRKLTREAERIRKVAETKAMVDENTSEKRLDESEMLSMAMEQITGEQRAILHMKEVEGMTYEVIATVLGIPEGTVGSRLNKARNDLRTSLLGLGWEV